MQRSSTNGRMSAKNNSADSSPDVLVKRNFPRFFNQGNRHVVQEIKSMSGGMTNQTIYVRTKSNEYIARVPGKGSSQYINREHESADTAIAAAAGVTPAPVYDEKNGYKITPFLTQPFVMNNMLLRNPEYMQQVVGVMKKLHTATPFVNDVNVFARLREWHCVLEEKEYDLPECYVELRETINKIEVIMQGFDIKLVPCHNDTTPGNFILSQGKMQIIDLEYAGNNDPLWDLACLSMEADLTLQQCNVLLRMYFGEKLTDDIRRRFFLYQPVVEYYACMWSHVQLANENFDKNDAALKELERYRLINCKMLVKGDFIQKEVYGKGVAADLQEEQDDDAAEKPGCLARCFRL